MKFLNLKLILISSLVFLQACNSSSNDNDTADTTRSTDTIFEVAASNEDFSTLVVALEATGLDAVLSDPEASFTVFAPTNAAFALLGQETIDALLGDIPALTSILTYHVLTGEVDSTAAIASAGQTVPTVNGESVGLSLDGSMLLVNTVTVTTADILTANGVIHVIDAVLLPPVKPETEPTLNIVETAIADPEGRFTTLADALTAADLVDALQGDGPFTVFAPTNDAFAMIDSDTLTALLADKDALQSLLLQHVVSGQVDAVTAYSLNGQSAETLSGAMIPVTIDAAADSLMFGGANVIIKDVYTTNGIIHVIDAVVVGDLELPMAPMSLVDVAVKDGNFTILVAALKQTGLDSVLSDLDEQYTVFAPNDDAFALLGQETIDSLTTEQLTDILKYHVISGATILADQAVAVAGSDDNEVGMANGQMATLTLDGSDLYINMSKVIVPNVMADNGVIHVVDQVILPPPM